jgi:beta-lactamase superfamily II metal-dependent hydrolase
MTKTLATMTCSMVLMLASAGAHAGAADKKLDVYWVDVEGGAATLFVTPAGESVLIDTGYPGDRDAQRIADVAARAGLKKLDHVVVTHFHVDHYGGLASLVKLIPVGTLHDHDLTTAPREDSQSKGFDGYKAAAVEARSVVKPGERLALKQSKGAAALSFELLGAREQFASAKGAKKNDAKVCDESKPHDPDATDNKNSVVSLVGFGAFRMFVGGDITWNTEHDLVCPLNRVGGHVDVYQSDHHGLDLSNNPVLIKTLAPTVAVVNNGARKAGEPNSIATLKAQPSIQALYQLHRNVRVGADKNTAPELTANMDEQCKANFIHMVVDSKGNAYTVSIPGTGHERAFKTSGKS